MIFKPGHSSDSLYRSLVEHAPFCIHGIDADRRLSFINPAGLRMLTIQSERSVVGQPYLSFVDFENRARVARLLDRAFEGKPSSFDFICDVGGRRREFASTFIPVQDADGTVGTVMGTSQDVTDERIAERQLEQSRRALQDAQSRACLGSWEYDPAVDETIWSDEMYRLYYRDPRQGAPQTIEQFLDLLHPADRALALDRHHRILNSDQPVKNLDLRTNPQHGPVRWLESTAVRVADPSDRKRFRVVGTAMDVTERKWTENALRESEHRFRTLCTHSAMGIFLTDVQGHCTYLNEAGCAITGLTALQSAGQGWARALHPDDCQRIVTEWSRAIERQAEFNVECRFLHSDGEIVWARVRSSLHRNDQGKVIGYIGSFVDITQEKTSQEKLLQSERRYRALVEHAPEAIVVFDPQSGRFVDFNDNALKLFGCDAEQLRCCNPFELSPPRQPDGRSSVEAAQGYIDQSLAGEFPVFEWVHRNTDGDDIACEIRLLRLELDSRTLIRGSVTDIRDRKRAEQQLRMTHFALESTDDAIFVIDRESRFVDVNAVACTRLGYRRDELLAMSVSDINPEYPITAWNRHWLDLKESGRLVFESTHQKSDGTRFPVEISKSYFEFDGNRYAFAFVRDIGQKKRTEERLKERENQLAHVSRLSTMGEMVAGIAHELNQPLYSIVNFSRATGNVLQSVRTEIGQRAEVLERCENDPSVARSVGTPPPRPDAARLTDQMVSDQLSGNEASSHPLSAAATSHSAKPQHLLPESVSPQEGRQVEHASSSHDVELERSVDTGPIGDRLDQVVVWNEQVGKAASRAGQIIRRLRGFVQRETAFSLMSLHDIIQDALELVGYETSRVGIVVRVEHEAREAMVYVDPIRTQQVLVNLLVNAVEAIEWHDTAQRQITITTSLGEGGVEVAVADTGPGLSWQDPRKMFAAFETTKNEGMGMGLAISNTIIESFGGRLWAEGNERGGATFRFTLPLQSTRGK